MAPIMEAYKMETGNLICLSGKGSGASIPSGGGTGSGSGYGGVDAKMREEMEDAVGDLMLW